MATFSETTPSATGATDWLKAITGKIVDTAATVYAATAVADANKDNLEAAAVVAKLQAQANAEAAAQKVTTATTSSNRMLLIGGIALAAVLGTVILLRVSK